VTALRQRRDLGKPLVENRRITYYVALTVYKFLKFYQLLLEFVKISLNNVSADERSEKTINTAFNPHNLGSNATNISYIQPFNLVYSTFLNHEVQ